MATRTNRARAKAAAAVSKAGMAKDSLSRVKKEDNTSRTTTTRTLLTKRKREDVANIETSAKRQVKRVKVERRDCDICADSYSTTNFPSLSSCDHDPTVCTDCYRKQFETKIDENKVEGWETCTCPLCGETVAEEEAHTIFPRRKSAQLDRRIKQVSLQQNTLSNDC